MAFSALAASSTGRPSVDPKLACEPCWTRDRRVSQAIGMFLGERMCDPCRRAEGVDDDDDRFERFQVLEVRPCASANGKGGAVIDDEGLIEQPTPPVARLRGDVAPPEEVAKDAAEWNGFAARTNARLNGKNGNEGAKDVAEEYRGKHTCAKPGCGVVLYGKSVHCKDHGPKCAGCGKRLRADSVGDQCKVCRRKVDERPAAKAPKKSAVPPKREPAAAEPEPRRELRENGELYTSRLDGDLVKIDVRVPVAFLAQWFAMQPAERQAAIFMREIGAAN
jgi:hypothetical protein